MSDMKPTPHHLNSFAVFRDHYEALLREAVTANPTRYRYGLESVHDVATKMTLALATGQANLSPTIKEAAHRLGIKPTATAIREFLCQPAQAERAEGGGVQQ